jgi:hypothetical protein
MPKSLRNPLALLRGPEADQLHAQARPDDFARFLDDGRICSTNNCAERPLRGIALGRRNWTFAGSQRGADMEAPAPSQQVRRSAGRLTLTQRHHRARRARAHASIRRSSSYAYHLAGDRHFVSAASLASPSSPVTGSAADCSARSGNRKPLFGAAPKLSLRSKIGANHRLIFHYGDGRPKRNATPGIENTDILTNSTDEADVVFN